MKYLKLLRANQWIKNIFILLPAFFGGVFSFDTILPLLYGFITFSLSASAVYIFNDIQDIEEDKQHYSKRHRPIPAGKISLKSAYGLSLLLIIVSFGLSIILLPIVVVYVQAGYVFLNILYSKILKQIAIVDLLIVSLGFVFRIVIGSVIVSVTLSFWLLLMTFLFSIFIVVAKRRDDFTTTESTPYMLRKVNKYYNLSFLNNMLSIIASILLVCYIMYTHSSPYFNEQPYFALVSSILVILGVMRYFQAIFVEEKGGSPTEFAFKDTFIRVIVILWVALFYYLIYFR